VTFRNLFGLALGLALILAIWATIGYMYWREWKQR
jgi:hypothetical protein